MWSSKLTQPGYFPAEKFLEKIEKNYLHKYVCLALFLLIILKNDFLLVYLTLQRLCSVHWEMISWESWWIVKGVGISSYVLFKVLSWHGGAEETIKNLTLSSQSLSARILSGVTRCRRLLLWNSTYMIMLLHSHSTIFHHIIHTPSFFTVKWNKSLYSSHIPFLHMKDKHEKI
jgi:hypothetical protein